MNQAYTVSQVNRYIKDMFLKNEALKELPVSGEISNCTYHTSGHIYFTLKDSGSRLSCVMFAGNRRNLDFTLKDGMSVVIIGSVGVYERDGKYQMYVSRVFRDGYGRLYEKLEMLKEKLSSEGLFSDVYKKLLPKYCGRIGVVTAETGAAIQDIVNITHRRNPYVQLYLYPAIVQGEEAAVSISKGIKYLDKMNLDVLIVGRGGGSFEDLFAFNEECVCRAIFECETPVISAVGHEVDTTLSDYVADMRAPTPSAAAELAVTEITKLYREFDILHNNLEIILERKIADCRRSVDIYGTRLKALSPDMQIMSKRQLSLGMADELDRLMTEKLNVLKNRLAINAGKLKGLSPLNRLSQGYSFVENDKGEAVIKKSQVNAGDIIRVNVSDGSFTAKVEEV